jgi:hypothetical protein
MSPFPWETRYSCIGVQLPTSICVSNEEVAMKGQLTLVVVLLCLFASGAVVYGQTESAAQTVDQLKLHLLELEAQEAELRARAVQIDEDIKPENIQRSLAGVGSTKPEELREARRRQLETEKKIVEAQLASLGQAKSRLQSDIATAEAQAYHQSAQPPGTFQRLASSVPRVPLFLLVGSFGVVLLVGVVALVFVKRRNRVV